MTNIYLGNEQYEIIFSDGTKLELSREQIKDISKLDDDYESSKYQDRISELEDEQVILTDKLEKIWKIAK